jgi:hypothetical protein
VPAAPVAAAKPAISSKLLGMKFMQRRAEADLRGRLRAEEVERADAARWVAAPAAPADGGAEGEGGGEGGEASGGRRASGGGGTPRLELEAEAASSVRAPASAAAAILAFRPARKSFGDFSAKTAAALAAVREAQATARAALDEAAVARERKAAPPGGGYDKGTVGDAEMAARCALARARRGRSRAARAHAGRPAARSRTRGVQSASRAPARYAASAPKRTLVRGLGRLRGRARAAELTVDSVWPRARAPRRARRVAPRYASLVGGARHKPQQPARKAAGGKQAHAADATAADATAADATAADAAAAGVPGAFGGGKKRRMEDSGDHVRF